MTQPLPPHHGQPYPQHLPPMPQPVPQGIVRLTVQGSHWKAFVPPTIKLNGYPIQSQWGTWDIPVPAGHHVVEGEAQALWAYGRASLAFQVAPGQVVPVFYNSPVLTFLHGNIGHAPQKTPGLTPLLLIGAAVAVGVLILVVLLALTV